LIRRLAPVCILAFAILGLASLTAVCDEPPVTGQPQIDALLKKVIENDGVSQLLDPALPATERDKQLSLVPKTYYLSITADGPLELTGATARLPAKISISHSNGTGNLTSNSDFSTEINFVSRDGQWYFANYEFMHLATGDVVILLVFVVGVVYLLSFLWAVRHAKKLKQGRLTAADYRHALNPASWGGLWKKSK
jgi:hypothetical protein